tara:strand:- start:188 stop:433 length:246 start_codon:yes stop_codon:yes gene_type:complete
MSKKRVTYKHEDKIYLPEKFSDSGKHYFNELVQLQAEIETLHKQIAVLQAASITFNARIREQLEETMLAPTLGEQLELENK